MHTQRLRCCVCDRIVKMRHTPTHVPDVVSRFPCPQCRTSNTLAQTRKFHHDIDTPEHNPNIEPTRSSAMNINVNLLRNDFQTVVVTFDESVNTHKKQYTYKLPKSITVAEGDKLLVLVRSRNPDAYKVVTVVSVDKAPKIDPEAQFTYKWAIGRLDNIMATHAAMEAKDAKIQSALATLDAALARVEASTKLKMAMEQLPPDVAMELKELFELANPAPSAAAQEYADEEHRAGGTD